MVQTMRDDEAVATPAPRRGRRRMQASLYLAVVMALLGGIGTLVLLKGQHQVQVAVTARPLVAGEQVHDVDFRFVDVGASKDVLADLLTPADVAQLNGRQAVRNVPAGGLVTRADIVEGGQAPQLRAMSIPIDTTHAAGGALSRADVVDVVDSSTGTAVYVVVNARVLATAEVGGTSKGLGAGGGHFFVTIAVDDAAALRLAAAITAGKVDVVRSTGATPVQASSPPTTVKR